MMFWSAVGAVAQTAYGFLTGTNSSTLEPGLYSVNVTDGQQLTPMKAAMYGLWGGAGDGKNYFCLLSSDYEGYQMAGLAVYDFEKGDFAFRSTGIDYGCSDLTYDLSTQQMYGVVCREKGSKTASQLVTIDLETGLRTQVAELSDKIRAIAADADGRLYAMSSASDLYRVNKQNGELTLIGTPGIVTLTDQVQSMEFDRDNGKLYWTGVDNGYNTFLMELDTQTAEILNRQSVEDNTLLGGLYIPFTVQGGGGEEQSAPEDILTVTVGNEGVAAHVQWTDNNPVGTRYRLTRYPDGKVFDDIAEKSFRDTTAMQACYFTYGVVAYNDAGNSNELKTNPVLAGRALEMPYAMDFSNPLAVAQWRVVDANSDQTLWRVNADNFQYFGSSFKQADDWLVSVPFRLEQGQEYRLRYKLHCPSILGSSENLQITLGTSDDPLTHTQILEKLENFTTSEPQERMVAFRPEQTANLVLGFHALSAPDQFQIQLFDIQLSAYAPRDLAVSEPEGEFLTVADMDYTCSAKVQNVGEEPMENFEVRLMDSEGRLWQTQTVAETLLPGEERTVEFTLTPREAGNLFLHTEVAASGDGNASNDVSPAFELEVRPATEQIVHIGSRTASPFLFPIAFEGFYYSFSQAIYRKEELGCGAARIKEIGYRYHSKASAPIENCQLELALSNTGHSTPADGWMDAEFMQKTYQGKATFGVGSHTLRLPFDEPFAYTGGNLCIQLSKLRDATFQEVHFDATDYPGEVRTAFAQNDNGEVVLTEVNGSSMLPDIYLIVEPMGAEGVSEAGTAPVVSLVGCGENRFRLVGGRLLTCRVYAADGRQVPAEVIADDTVSLTGLTAGIYFVQVQTKLGTMVCKVQVK